MDLYKSCYKRCCYSGTCIKSECVAYGSDKYYYMIMLEFVENMINFIKIDDFEIFMSLLEQSFCYAEKYKEL